MKKVICLIFIFITLILMPVFSRADIGAPGIPEYKAIVVEQNGIELLDYDYRGTGTVIPFNTQVSVIHEFFTDNVGYAYIACDGEEGYVNIEAIQALTKEVNLSEFQNVENRNLEMYAYKEGAYLYKGPSVTYGKVDNNVMIEVGDTVKILYEAGGEAWGYVNYNGTKGWVYYYQLMDQGLQEGISSLCTKMAKKQTVITYIDNLKLVSSPDNREDYLDVEIPKQTKLEYQYVFQLHEQPYVYVTYNGVNGWLNASSENAVLETKDAYIYIRDKSLTKIYEEPFDVEKQPNNLENGKVYRMTHYATDHTGEKVICVAEIDGKEYWLKENFIENYNPGFFYMYEIEDSNYYLVKNECKVYADMNENSEVVATLEQNKIIRTEYINYGMQIDNEMYRSYMYVPNLGFAKIENLEYIDGVDSNNENLISFSETDEEEEEINNEENEVTEIKEVEEIAEINNFSSMQIAIMCIVIAIIVSVTAIVTIKLVNKKKDK